MTTPADLEAALVKILTAPDDARRALLARLGGNPGTSRPAKSWKDMLTPAQAAPLFGVSEKQVREWIRRKKIPFFLTPSGRPRIDPDDIQPRRKSSQNV